MVFIVVCVCSIKFKINFHQSQTTNHQSLTTPYSSTAIEDILEYYMGKNTPERQEFIIENLRAGLDELKPEEQLVDEEVTEAMEAVEE